MLWTKKRNSHNQIRRERARRADGACLTVSYPFHSSGLSNCLSVRVWMKGLPVIASDCRHGWQQSVALQRCRPFEKRKFFRWLSRFWSVWSVSWWFSERHLMVMPILKRSRAAHLSWINLVGCMSFIVFHIRYYSIFRLKVSETRRLQVSMRCACGSTTSLIQLKSEYHNCTRTAYGHP